MRTSLERILGTRQISIEPRLGDYCSRFYQRVNMEGNGPPKKFGLIDPQPFQFGYDLGGGFKLDFHGPDTNTLTHGHLKTQDGAELLREFNGYECSMLDLVMKDKFKKFP